MSAEEYGLWMAQFAAEPWGEDRMDVGMGIIASTMANINRRQGAQPYTVSDFAPYLRSQDEANNPAKEEDTPMQFIKGLSNG